MLISSFTIILRQFGRRQETEERRQETRDRKALHMGYGVEKMNCLFCLLHTPKMKYLKEFQ
jgi:hypothetical protein